MKKKKWLKTLAGAGIGMAVGIFILLITTHGYFPVIPQIITDFENKTYDLRYTYEEIFKEFKNIYRNNQRMYRRLNAGKSL